ncbi:MULTISPECIES: LysR family transcriptional regulator [unclassified Amycolatopsis]|uniref:LysR family transcriptional regulator n=1 Tax=unclassified Amycolatopsis TaxID=2618356 RepID=UPI001C69A904|nr:LysR family transcriptional regulator [Amycolatopsis sp. DSM 110486]QYN18794.1 LysR family transcriptional regulator [Amycolatopsis sp. DSM 110486]
MVELRHLEYFRTVAELGSIAKAATALHMTQPTLSRQIAQLERNLGYRLFQRSARGAALTPAGEGLRAHVGAIFVQVDRIPEVLEAAERAERLVRLGIPPGLPHRWFEMFRGALAEAAPSVKLSLHEATTDEQRQLVLGGLVDIGLLHVDPPELHSSLVVLQRFGCAVRDSSRFEGRRTMTLRDLEGMRVLAHSAQDNPGEEVRLRASVEAEDVKITWLFRRFSEHSSLIAETAGADAVLVGETSARRHFPGWRWIPLDPADEVNALVRTWAVWVDLDRPGVRECLDAMAVVADRAA